MKFASFPTQVQEAFGAFSGSEQKLNDKTFLSLNVLSVQAVRFAHRGKRPAACRALRADGFDDFSMDVGQSILAALVTEGQARVVDTA